MVSAETVTAFLQQQLNNNRDILSFESKQRLFGATTDPEAVARVLGCETLDMQGWTSVAFKARIAVDGDGEPHSVFIKVVVQDDPGIKQPFAICKHLFKQEIPVLKMLQQLREQHQDDDNDDQYRTLRHVVPYTVFAEWFDEPVNTIKGAVCLEWIDSAAFTIGKPVSNNKHALDCLNSLHQLHSLFLTDSTEAFETKFCSDVSPKPNLSWFQGRKVLLAPHLSNDASEDEIKEAVTKALTSVFDKSVAALKAYSSEHAVTNFNHGDIVAKVIGDKLLKNTDKLRKAHIAGMLACSIPPDGASRLTLAHGDLHTGNVFFGRDGQGMRIVDWAAAALSDPVGDMIRLVVCSFDPELVAAQCREWFDAEMEKWRGVDDGVNEDSWKARVLQQVLVFLIYVCKALPMTEETISPAWTSVVNMCFVLDRVVGGDIL